MPIIALRPGKKPWWIWAIVVAIAIAFPPLHGRGIFGANAFRPAEQPPRQSAAVANRRCGKKVIAPTRSTTSCIPNHKNSAAESFSWSLFSSWSPPPEDEDGSPAQDDSGTPPAVSVGSSLELLALSVAIFFLATVGLVGGDQLFAKAPSTAGAPRVVIDADAVLREDFEKSSTAVLF